MKKLLMLMALAGLGCSMLGCAGETKPPAPVVVDKPADKPADVPAAAPAPEEKK